MLTSAPVRRAGWATMTVLASGLALLSARYSTLDPAVFLASQAATSAAHIGPVLLHVGGGLTALAVGPWQFWRGLRTRRPALHRAMGRIYVTAVVAAAACGAVDAAVAPYDPPRGPSRDNVITWESNRRPLVPEIQVRSEGRTDASSAVVHPLQASQ